MQEAPYKFILIDGLKSPATIIAMLKKRTSFGKVCVESIVGSAVNANVRKSTPDNLGRVQERFETAWKQENTKHKVNRQLWQNNQIKNFRHYAHGSNIWNHEPPKT